MFDIKLPDLSILVLHPQHDRRRSHALGHAPGPEERRVHGLPLQERRLVLC